MTFTFNDIPGNIVNKDQIQFSLTMWCSHDRMMCQFDKQWEACLSAKAMYAVSTGCHLYWESQRIWYDGEKIGARHSPQ